MYLFYLKPIRSLKDLNTITMFDLSNSPVDIVNLLRMNY